VRLVTWNINSIRARLPLVQQFVDAYQPDIIALQETKVQDPQFPQKALEDMGFNHFAIKGQKSHHGVAILSKIPLADVQTIDWCKKGDARHVAARLGNSDVVLHNFYVPAGGDEPDEVINDKFAHKMQFLKEMTDWSSKIDAPSIMVGDLNIAPLEHDVWDTKKLKKVVSHTPVEREGMAALQAAHGWHDVMRAFVPGDEKLYSWWSYRAKDWRAANKGRRLDHVWTSPELKNTAHSMQVVLDARGWEKPSDHAPVIVDFDLPV